MPLQKLIYDSTEQEIINAIAANKRSLAQSIILLSPKAEPFLKSMSIKAKSITQQRFGNTIQLFAPLYLSNECNNICTYCGFSFENKIPRKTLTDKEIVEEALFLKNKGFEHILLVTGEDNHHVGVKYLLEAIALLKPIFANISIEVQPLEVSDYKLLKEAGVYAVVVYQETYNIQRYAQYHPKGKKANYTYRLNTSDRIGQAQIHKIGLGILLGLADWRIDAAYLLIHLNYLQKKYWQSRFSVSFPRLRPHEGNLEIAFPSTEKNLLQLITAFRLADADLEIVLSTRERAAFREELIHCGITTMSAGSKTNPGGYAQKENALEQFAIDDDRPVHQIAEILTQNQLQPIWKDWDRFE
jgi:2-iminoacetate synthase